VCSVSVQKEPDRDGDEKVTFSLPMKCSRGRVLKQQSVIIMIMHSAQDVIFSLATSRTMVITRHFVAPTYI